MSPTSKSRIDRLGERLKTGEVSDDDLRELDTYRESFAEASKEVVAAIRDVTGLEPGVRPAKTTISIIEKLHREKTMKLSQMQGIAGCRVVVPGTREQDRVVGLLGRAFPRAKVVDRRQKPSHGYRAVHMIATVRDKLVEIQLRTELQNLWAQQSEILSDRIDPRIKYGGGNQAILKETSTWIVALEAEEATYSKMAGTFSEPTAKGYKRETLQNERARLEKLERDIAEGKARLIETFKELNKLFEERPRKVN